MKTNLSSIIKKRYLDGKEISPEYIGELSHVNEIRNVFDSFEDIVSYCDFHGCLDWSAWFSDPRDIYMGLCIQKVYHDAYNELLQEGHNPNVLDQKFYFLLDHPVKTNERYFK